MDQVPSWLIQVVLFAVPTTAAWWAIAHSGISQAQTAEIQLLRDQLADKDARVQHLEQEVLDRQRDINDLRQRVEDLEADLAGRPRAPRRYQSWRYQSWPRGSSGGGGGGSGGSPPGQDPSGGGGAQS